MQRYWVASVEMWQDTSTLKCWLNANYRENYLANIGLITISWICTTSRFDSENTNFNVNALGLLLFVPLLPVICQTDPQSKNM